MKACQCASISPGISTRPPPSITGDLPGLDLDRLRRDPLDQVAAHQHVRGRAQRRAGAVEDAHVPEQRRVRCRRDRGRRRRAPRCRSPARRPAMPRPAPAAARPAAPPIRDQAACAPPSFCPRSREPMRAPTPRQPANPARRRRFVATGKLQKNYAKTTAGAAAPSRPPDRTTVAKGLISPVRNPCLPVNPPAPPPAARSSPPPRPAPAR